MTSLAQRSAPARLALALWDRAVSIYDLAKTVISYDPRGVVDLLRVLGSVKRHGKRLRAGAPWNLLEEWRAAVDDAPDVELARRADECDGQLPRVTYAQADAAADEVAKWLADEPPGAVALLCHSSCEFLILLIGCLKARRPAALVNTSLEGAARRPQSSDDVAAMPRREGNVPRRTAPRQATLCGTRSPTLLATHARPSASRATRSSSGTRGRSC